MMENCSATNELLNDDQLKNLPLPPSVLALSKYIRDLPEEYRQHAEPLLLEVVDNLRNRQKLLFEIQESLSQLRMDMKYLDFDLHATRQERDELQELIDGLS